MSAHQHTPGNVLGYQYNKKDGYVHLSDLPPDSYQLRECRIVPLVRESDYLALRAQNAELLADLLAALVQSIESAGFHVCGPTDSRVAEHGEPAWVCNARLAIARATGSAS